MKYLLIISLTVFLNSCSLSIDSGSKIRNKETGTEENSKELLIVHVPSLLVVLLNEEREKGSPLTKIEVLDIRDKAECIVMPVNAFRKVEESRGYQDIDPEHVWEQWQKVRLTFVESKK